MTIHPDVATSLNNWKEVVKKANWQSLNDIRKTFPKTDMVKLISGHTVFIFDIKGNKYRLITAIHFNRQNIYIREFLTHADYSKEDWKKRN